MRGYNQEPNQRRPIFSRTPDGRLRSGGIDVQQPQVFRPNPNTVTPNPDAPSKPITTPKDIHDIGDVWTDQERIRIKEAWERRQKKEAKKQQRKGHLFGKKHALQVSAPATLPHTTAAPTEAKEIALSIHMPSLPDMSVLKKLLKLPMFTKKRLIIGGGVVLVGIAGVGAYAMWNHHRMTATAHVKNNGAVKIEHLDPAKQTGKPDYDTVLPSGKSIEDFGGWVRVSPPEKNPVYAYADKIDNVLINISEQPLPDAFKSNTTTSMENLAKQFSASNKLTAGDITAYIGTSAKGPQSVLFVKDDLLILMKSATKISDDHWAVYIQSLQ